MKIAKRITNHEKNKRQKTCFNRVPGFSLVEVMVVLVIIGLLAGIVTISVSGYVDTGRTRRAQADIANLSTAVKTYYANNGRYPTLDEGLEKLVEAKLIDSLPLDPWGNAYQYESPGRESEFEIICFGADGNPGGEPGSKDADISNWTMAQANSETAQTP